MSTENPSLIDYYSTNENQFKCDICSLKFRTSCERNMHILNHLEKSSCSVCHETLVRIGNIWYGPHKHVQPTAIVKPRPSNTDEFETTTATFEDFQFDPLSTKTESNSMCDTNFDDGFLEKNYISGVPSVKCENVTDIHAEPIETPICDEWSASTSGNKAKNGRSAAKASESTETSLKNKRGQEQRKRNKSPKSVVTGTKRQKRSSRTSTKKCWKCELCNAEFLFEANLIEHQDEHEKRSLQASAADNDGKTENSADFDAQSNATGIQLSDTSTKVKSENNTNRAIEAAVVESNASKNEKEIDADTIDWICEYCNLDFDVEINLAKHLMREHNADKSEQHNCSICIEKFTELEDLLAHMRDHIESNQYKCSIAGCGHGFAYKSSLEIHLHKHNRLDSQTILRKTQDNVSEVAKQYAQIFIDGLNDLDFKDKKPMKCNICSKDLVSRTTLLSHIQNLHMNQRTHCPNESCNKFFSSVVSLRCHIKRNHPEDAFKCESCEKVFYSKAEYHEHQKRWHDHSESSTESFACNICTMTFVGKRELRQHYDKHEKDISCTLCNEKFPTVKSMMTHRERHGQKQILTCRYENCSQVFEDRREFMKHTSQHPVAGKKRFICPHCGKSISRSHIKDHINLHTKAISHECTYCEKSFLKKSSLHRHLFIHTNKKPYVCDIVGCAKAYRDSIDLKRHKFSVHKIYTKKHICSICSKVFSERKLLTKHTITVHNKIDHTNSMNTI